jgi:hypothetical protein
MAFTIDSYLEVKMLPIGTEISDNFSPTLRSEIFVKEYGGVWLAVHNPIGIELYKRYVSWSQLDIMVFGR